MRLARIPYNKSRLGGALLIIFAVCSSAWASEKALHTFTFSNNGAGGVFPLSGLTTDAQGNLYGTTNRGGPFGDCAVNCGVVFKLTRQSNGSFAYSILHGFVGPLPDGGQPFGAPFLDRAGNLFGITYAGGHGICNGGSSGGVAYKLSPGANGKWTETIIHEFNGLTGDGCFPYSYIISDKAGNLYGTTNEGGTLNGIQNTFCFEGCGSVFKLAPNLDGTYTETVIHSFSGTDNDGRNPFSGLVMDAHGNLWGTTYLGGSGCGGSGCGTVFELSPTPDGGWNETRFNFTGNSTGMNPYGGLVIDKSGNLYGTTVSGGVGHGIVFKIGPKAGGGFIEGVLHKFGSDGAFPFNPLAIDGAGNLYGSTSAGGTANAGVLFKLTRGTTGGFTYGTLYSFQNKNDGGAPQELLVIDVKGNVFGTSGTGGNFNGECSGNSGCGVVWEFQP